MKVADVKIFWTPSPSADVEKVIVKTTVNGSETMSQFGPEVIEMMIEVAALGSVTVQIDVIDKEGLTGSSEIHSFVLGDLEAPQPVTNVGHEIVGIRDVP